MVATLFVSYAERIVYKRLNPRVKKSSSVWDDALLEALHLPLKLFIWLIGITLAAQVAGAYTEHDFLKNILDYVALLFMLRSYIFCDIKGLLAKLNTT